MGSWLSAQTYHVGAHFAALIQGILMAPLKTIERFFLHFELPCRTVNRFRFLLRSFCVLTPNFWIGTMWLMFRQNVVPDMSQILYFMRRVIQRNKEKGKDLCSVNIAIFKMYYCIRERHFQQTRENTSQIFSWLVWAASGFWMCLVKRDSPSSVRIFSKFPRFL